MHLPRKLSVVQTVTNSNLNHTFSAPAGTYKVRVTDANYQYQLIAPAILAVMGLTMVL